VPLQPPAHLAHRGEASPFRRAVTADKRPSVQPDILDSLRSYRAWIPAALITFAHFSISWVR
jgi:hypothetical protein